MKNTKLLVLNALVAAIYVALSLSLAPFAFGAIQFRISETLNHLYIFNKKLVYGILLGVAIANFFSFGLIDVFIGPLASFVAFLGAMFFTRNITDVYKKMLINNVCCAFGMVFIAIELYFVANLPFLPTFGTMFLSELIVMIIGTGIFGIIKNNQNFFDVITE